MPKYFAIRIIEEPLTAANTDVVNDENHPWTEGETGEKEEGGTDYLTSKSAELNEMHTSMDWMENNGPLDVAAEEVVGAVDSPIWRLDPSSTADSPEEELQRLRRLHARLVHERGTINCRVDMMYPDCAKTSPFSAGPFVYTSNRQRVMFESERKKIAADIAAGKTTRAERERAAAKTRSDLSKAIGRRLKNVKEWADIAAVYVRKPDEIAVDSTENER